MIRGSKVSLREIKSEDTDNIIRWRNYNDVKKNFFFQEDLTREQHEWWLENKVKKGEVCQFIIFHNETGIDIGSVFLRDIDKKNMKAEYGIFIGEDFARGKGFGTEAANLICKYAFEELKLHRIFLRVFSHNIQAKNSYEKAGFKKEALLKDDIYINGKFYDVDLMAKINKI